MTRPRNLMVVALAVVLAVAACSPQPGQSSGATQVSAADLYGYQERCGRDAAEAFKRLEGVDLSSPTATISYTNHYSPASNKCYMLINDLEILKDGQVSVTNTLWDANENKELAVYYMTQPGTDRNCEVLQAKCNSEDEFKTLIKPYMG